MVILPALLMVSTVRFRSFKTFDLQLRRSYTVLLVVAQGVALAAETGEQLTQSLVGLSFDISDYMVFEPRVARPRRRPR